MHQDWIWSWHLEQAAEQQKCCLLATACGLESPRHPGGLAGLPRLKVAVSSHLGHERSGGDHTSGAKPENGFCFVRAHGSQR